MAYKQEACLLRNGSIALRYLHFADHTFRGPLIHQHHYPESHRLVSRVAPCVTVFLSKALGCFLVGSVAAQFFAETFAARSLRVPLSVQPLAGRSNL